MRSLFLARHAKSDWPVGMTDAERPLAARGRRDAPAVGAWLATQVGASATALVSPAARTRQTWALMADALPGAAVVFEEELYDAPWQRMLDVVARHAHDAESLIVVAHNPGCEDLALRLSEGESGASRERLAQKFPTAAVAHLQARSDEAEQWWCPGGATLAAFEVCRG